MHFATTDSVHWSAPQIAVDRGKDGDPISPGPNNNNCAKSAVSTAAQESQPWAAARNRAKFGVEIDTNITLPPAGAPLRRASGPTQTL
eukprot:COSAG02_NODE_215_length_28614_cov_43.077047_22_plen_88_part_00